MLKKVDLRGTQVLGNQLWRLGKLTRLHTLNLSSTPVADSALRELRHLSSLRRLDLRKTKITDAGLKHLGALTGIRTLYLSSPPLDEEAIKKLKASRPNMRVYD